MPTIVSAVLIDAPLMAVWEAVSDLSSHIEWMVDAESIEFDGSTTAGPGTRMRVATRIGPMPTLDLIEITEWEEGRTIAARHTGLVKGKGRFELAAMAGGTRLRWSEQLAFPPWAGGPVAAFLAQPILAWVWRRNLRTLKGHVERAPGTTHTS